MARFEPEAVITQSLLDRITQDTDKDDVSGAAQKAGSRGIPQISWAESFREFKKSLARDLEWLLNTRRTPLPAPAGYRLLGRSIFNYGLPDVAATSAQSSRDRNRLLESLQEAIEIYEPRLTDVKVIMETTTGSKALRFHIEGLARVDPAPERVSFDTVLELTSGEYEVK
jgi:type VI secretion system protein ImpF